MIQLEALLRRLDPDASESLKVISFFDALVAHGVGVPGLLRGAAALTGADVVFSDSTAEGSAAFNHAGFPIPVPPPSSGRLDLGVGDEEQCWVAIERDSAEQANDRMVLERLALAIQIVRARSSPRGGRPPLETLLDPRASDKQHVAAARRLHIDPAHVVSVHVVREDDVDTAGAAIVHSDHGTFRAWIDPSIPVRRAGIGRPSPASTASSTVDDAIVALMLTSKYQPVVRVEDLGLLRFLPTLPASEPDYQRLRQAILQEKWAADTLDAITATSSLRRAAELLHLHHSTLQARVTRLRELLGFDFREPLGQTRLMLLTSTYRLANFS